MKIIKSKVKNLCALFPAHIYVCVYMNNFTCEYCEAIAAVHMMSVVFFFANSVDSRCGNFPLAKSQINACVMYAFSARLLACPMIVFR